jgi:hypothetical protein
MAAEQARHSWSGVVTLQYRFRPVLLSQTLGLILLIKNAMF